MTSRKYCQVDFLNFSLPLYPCFVRRSFIASLISSVVVVRLSKANCFRSQNKWGYNLNVALMSLPSGLVNLTNVELISSCVIYSYCSILTSSHSHTVIYTYIVHIVI